MYQKVSGSIEKYQKVLVCSKDRPCLSLNHYLTLVSRCQVAILGQLVPIQF